MTVEGFARRAIAALAEDEGLTLNEVAEARLVAVWSHGRMSFVAELDAHGQRNVVGGIAHHGEAGLRASCSALRALSEPSVAAADEIEMLGAHGERLARGRLERSGKR